jgi:hypothetical protein
MSSPLDALIGSAGNAATWAGGISPVKPVTDQSDHVNGGMSSSSGTNASAGTHAKSVMYWSAGIVIGTLILLWVTGGVGLRTARL